MRGWNLCIELRITCEGEMLVMEAAETCRPGSQHITHSFCIHSPSSPGCGITNTGVCECKIPRYPVSCSWCWCHKCRLMSPLSCSARRRDTPGMRGATWGAGAGDTAAPTPAQSLHLIILSRLVLSLITLSTRPANCLITGLDRSLHLPSISTSNIAKIYS